MRHRVKKSTFNRDTKHRQAMLVNGVRHLLLHGALKTTRAKAKEYRRLTDKMIGKAQKNTLASRRQLHEFFGKRDVVNALVEQIAPLYKKRTSGFTTMSALGLRRGDNTEMVKLELINKPEKLGTFKNPQPKKVAKKVAKKAPKPKAASKAKPATKKAETKKAPDKKTSAKKAAPKKTAKKSTPKKSTKKTTKKASK